MILSSSLTHGVNYHFRIHSGKLDSLCSDDFKNLIDYLLETRKYCPKEYFLEGPRSSSLRFQVGADITKVHHEVKTRANQGYSVIYVGHAGHDEAVGTMAVAPDHVYLVEKPADVDALTDVDPSAVALLAQTTLAIDDWADVRVRVNERFPDAWMPGRSDLCFATTNRQAALLQLCNQVDSVVIIGSENSSNTMALVRMAQARCTGRVVRVNDVEELPAGLTGTVGVTAGASAPEDVVQAVIARLAPRQGFQIVDAIDEDEYFPPPRELRGLFADLTAIARVAFDIPNAVSPLSDDRQRDAAHALG